MKNARDEFQTNCTSRIHFTSHAKLGHKVVKLVSGRAELRYNFSFPVSSTAISGHSLYARRE